MSDLDDIVTLAVVYVAIKALDTANEYVSEVVPKLQDTGVRAYEAIHDDEAHKRDLPGKQWTRAQIESLAAATGFPDPHFAYAIVMAESGGVPRALTHTDREESVGLFQINIRAHKKYTREQMMDPVQNAKAAFAISKGGTDWRPWSVYKTGRYKRFL